MVKVEELTGNFSSWIDKSCRPQAKSEELSCDVDIPIILTSRVINRDRMDTVCMKNSRIVELKVKRQEKGQGASSWPSWIHTPRAWREVYFFKKNIPLLSGEIELEMS